MHNNKGKMPLARLQLMPIILEWETEYLDQLGRKHRTAGTSVSFDRTRQTSPLIFCRSAGLLLRSPGC